MQTRVRRGLSAVLVVVGVAARRIVVSRWLARRISDRMLVLLLIGRLPVLAVIWVTIVGGFVLPLMTLLPVIALVAAATALPRLLGYPILLRQARASSAQRDLALQEAKSRP